MSNTATTDRRTFRFAAIDPYLEINIAQPTERRMPGKDIIEWGTGNAYPDYLLELYNSVPTLRSIIDGSIDFIAGDDVTIAPLNGLPTNQVNRRGDTVMEQVRDLAKDYEIYGGFFLQVIRNLAGEVAEIYYMDARFVRTNKEGDVFYYSEDWATKKSSKNVLVYPAFMPSLDWANLDEDARAAHASSVLFVKSVHTQVYPAPRYMASVKSCEIERSIDDFHLNSVNNGFAASMLVNFNNGVPDDEQMEEIEDAFNEKFSGHQNAGRIMFSWNDNKESATEIVTPTTEDFGERYNTLAQRSRQQIFTAFRANPNLFGIPTDGNGFSNEEYEESFKLYNRTHVLPIQRIIADAYEKIYGAPKVLTIVPFSLGGDTEHKIS